MQVSGISGVSSGNWYLNQSPTLKSGSSSGEASVLQSKIETLQEQLVNLSQNTSLSSKDLEKKQKDINDQIQDLQDKLSKLQTSDKKDEQDSSKAAANSNANSMNGDIQDRLELTPEGKKAAMSAALMQGLASANGAQQVAQAKESVATDLDAAGKRTEGRIAMAKACDEDTSADEADLNNLRAESAAIRSSAAKTLSSASDQIQSAMEGGGKSGKADKEAPAGDVDKTGSPDKDGSDDTSANSAEDVVAASNAAAASGVVVPITSDVSVAG